MVGGGYLERFGAECQRFELGLNVCRVTGRAEVP